MTLKIQNKKKTIANPQKKNKINDTQVIHTLPRAPRKIQAWPRKAKL